MARTYRLGPLRKLVNAIVRPMIRLGVGGRGLYLLGVPGMRYTVPVTLIEHGGRRWLVAPYGEVGWVRKAREAGEVTVSRGRQSWVVPLEQVPPEKAAPVLREYLRRVPVVRPYFDAGADSPLDELVADAPRHPVFRLPF